MRSNLEDNGSDRVRMNAPKVTSLSLALTGDFIIPARSPFGLVFDPNGSNRIIRLPGLSSDRLIMIQHSGSANTLTVTDSLGTTVLVLGTGEGALFAAASNRWLVTTVDVAALATFAVRYDVAQTLTTPQKAQAKANIEITKIYPAADGTTAVQVLKADGTTVVLDVDTTNGRIGVGAVAPDALVTINANTVVAPGTLDSGTYLHIVGPNSGIAKAIIDSYATAGGINGRRANTSAAAPSALAANDLIFFFGGEAYHSGGNYGTIGASIRFLAGEAQTATALGQFIDFYTVVNGTAASALAARILPSGGLSVGATTDPGTGCILANSKIRPGSFTVATLPAGVAGDMVFCSNARMFTGLGVQEGAAAGTGGVLNYNGTAWKVAGTNVTASA